MIWRFYLSSLSAVATEIIQHQLSSGPINVSFSDFACGSRFRHLIYFSYIIKCWVLHRSYILIFIIADSLPPGKHMFMMTNLVADVWHAYESWMGNNVCHLFTIFGLVTFAIIHLTVSDTHRAVFTHTHNSAFIRCVGKRKKKRNVCVWGQRNRSVQMPPLVSPLYIFRLPICSLVRQKTHINRCKHSHHNNTHQKILFFFLTLDWFDYHKNAIIHYRFQ